LEEFLEGFEEKEMGDGRDGRDARDSLIGVVRGVI